MTDDGAATLSAARDRVADERDAVAAKREAYEEFRREIARIPAEGVDCDGVAGGGAADASSASGAVACRAPAVGDAGSRIETVRERFATLIRPHSLADVETSGRTESLAETIEAEFDAGVARLLTEPGSRFTPETSAHLRTLAATRRDELGSMESVLAREAESLDAAGDLFADAERTVATACDPDPLTLGFETLRARHEELGRVRDRCGEALDARQDLLQQSAGGTGAFDIDHREVVRYLYESLDATYPVLAAGTDLLERCEGTRKTLRDQITRRV